jgi:hypothetical protein
VGEVVDFIIYESELIKSKTEIAKEEMLLNNEVFST